MKIPDEIIEEIRTSNDIVALIADYVPIKKAGRNFKALCPFHTEKTPSFIVNPEKQIFHCFGCGVGGNIFNFLMIHEKISFFEAVDLLAKRARIKLPKTGTRVHDNENDVLYQANSFAAEFYHRMLIENTSGKVAREYLTARGFTHAIQNQFLLGYAPAQNNALIRTMQQLSITPEVLYKAGLVTRTEDNNNEYRDFFRNRIIFPIFNLTGRIIGFGGRVLDESLPKYINSPETPIYQKGKILYGLYQSKSVIRHCEEVIVVEGYTDLLGLFKSDVKNVVASLGTAFTSEQAQLLSRYAKYAVVIFDADEPGVKAALRCIELLIEAGLEVKPIILPAGEDPASFVERQGGESLRELISQSPDFIDFLVTQMRSTFDLNTVDGKINVLTELCKITCKIKDMVRRKMYIQRIAERLGVPDTIVVDAINKSVKSQSKPRRVVPQDSIIIKEDTGILNTECALLKLLLIYPETYELIRDKILPEDFFHQEYQQIFYHICTCIDEKGMIEVKGLLDKLSDENLKKIVTALMITDVNQIDKSKIEKEVQDYIRKIKQKKLTTRINQLEEQIKHAQDSQDNNQLTVLLVERQHLARKLMALYNNKTFV